MKMTTSEKRSCRREWVNFCLQTNYRLGMITNVDSIKGFVREAEKKNYGNELRVYRKV